MNGRMKKIGFIGAGNMAEAIISAAISFGVGRRNIIVSDIDKKRLASIRKKFGINAASGNIALVAESDVIFLCVKPQQFSGVLDEISAAVGPSHLVISIAAGIQLKSIEKKLPFARVIRTMPNTPLMVGCGVIAYSVGNRARRADALFLEKLLSRSAFVIRVPEGKMDSITAVSGSGPAYIFYIVEIMIKAARKLGLDESSSRLLVVNTVKGAAKMLDSGTAPEVLRAKVTSPGGTTEAAIKYLGSKNFGKIFTSAIFRARKRARELSIPVVGSKRQ